MAIRAAAEEAVGAGANAESAERCTVRVRVGGRAPGSAHAAAERLGWTKRRTRRRTMSKYSHCFVSIQRGRMFLYFQLPYFP